MTYTDNQIRAALCKEHQDYLEGNPVDDDDMTLREYEDYVLDMSRAELLEEVEGDLDDFMSLHND